MSAMAKVSITCSGCGQPLDVNANDSGTVLECLWCGTRTPVAARTTSSSAVRAEPSSSRPSFSSPPRSDLATDDEDSSPYRLDAAPERPCPDCGRSLPADAVLCPSCGFDQKTGTRLRRTYEPLQRIWDAGWPLTRRIRLFVIGEALVLPFGLIGAWSLGQWSAFVGPWFVFTVLSVFILGTFSRTELSRNPRGKVRLTHTWRVCFVPQATQTIRLSEYEGVACGQAPDPDAWDWLVLICLTLAGIVLGILWWYFVIHPESFHVSLTKDHGFPERTLYRGWDESLAQEMANTIRAVGFGGS